MTRRLVSFVLAALTAGGVAAPVMAQTPPATIGERYVPAPWWMRDPVIASVGHVRVEIPTNRAQVSATFQTIERSATEASAAAADKVRALSQALAAYGEDTVRVETSLTTRPIYDQYRDGDGVLRDNVRADRVARYQVDATINVTVRDTRVLERVYATLVAAQPTSLGQVSFQLQPENETVTSLANLAVRDAANRARAAAEAAGGRLGPVRVIDPSGRACQTDVLAGWPSYGASQPLPTTVDQNQVVVVGSRLARTQDFEATAPVTTVTSEALLDASSPAPGEASIDAARLALQPPLRWLSATACVVYGIGS